MKQTLSKEDAETSSVDDKQNFNKDRQKPTAKEAVIIVYLPSCKW